MPQVEINTRTTKVVDLKETELRKIEVSFKNSPPTVKAVYYVKWGEGYDKRKLKTVRFDLYKRPMTLADLEEESEKRLLNDIKVD